MIRINVDNIETLEQAKTIIVKLEDALNNCPSATFTVCKHCKSIITQGWLCYNCGKDQQY